jgi:hypothetical protein
MAPNATSQAISLVNQIPLSKMISLKGATMKAGKETF